MEKICWSSDSYVQQADPDKRLDGLEEDMSSSCEEWWFLIGVLSQAGGGREVRAS